MTALLYAVAALLCGILLLASFLARMYGETLHLHKRRDRGAFARFVAEVQPRLGYNAEHGQTRFALVQFGTLILLSLDLFYLAARRSALEAAWIEALALTASATVVFAQILPALAALRTEGRWAVRLAWAGRLLGALAQPALLLGDFAASLAAVRTESEGGGSAQRPGAEIDALLDAGQHKGLIDHEDRKLIHSVVGFGDKTVREVMTPRPSIVAIAAERTLEDVRLLMRQQERSRIPVYAGSIDSVTGFIHSRDLLDFGKEELAAKQAGSIARTIGLVPETKRIQELMREMQEARAQMAIVIDEYGQTAGLVTMEDMMEEIVGEIEDETDPVRDVQPQPDDSFIALGSLDLDRLHDLVDYRPDASLESTTIGGLVCETLGQVPAAGAKVRVDSLEVEVLASDQRRVDRVRLRRRAPAPETRPAAP